MHPERIGKRSESFAISQATCGASASAPTAIVTQGAGERK